MEINGEAQEDQGSGWLQVKKKHRSSSKSSLQCWVGGFSGKHTSNILRSQAPVPTKGGNSEGKNGSQHSKAGEDFTMHRWSNSANSNSTSNEEKKAVHYLDKCVVSQNNDCPKSLLLRAAANCENRVECVEEVPRKDKHDAFQKFKWGDLDDGALALHLKNTVGTEIKFGDISSDQMTGRKAEDATASISNTSASADAGENKLLVQSVNADHVLSVGDEGSYKEVDVSSEDVKTQVTNETIVYLKSDNSEHGETCHEQVISVNSDSLDIKNVSGSNANEMCGIVLELPEAVCEAGDSETLDVPVVDGVSTTVAIPQDLDSLTSQQGEAARPQQSIAASFNDTGFRHTTRILEDLPSAQILRGNGNGDLCESKERFRQRLWCFLFENLNRAVDELYLLCELECDLEQMQEAILVLEEAASDFKELNSRVEEFEKVKKSISPLTDGQPLVMKSDHCRPHALSWEVRRMTTSPHRAEILASSLEAFRKIQLERAKMRATSDAEKVGFNCHPITSDVPENYACRSSTPTNSKEAVLRKHSGVSDVTQGSLSGDKRNSDSSRPCRINSAQNCHLPLQNPPPGTNASRLPLREHSAASISGKSKREQVGSTSENERLLQKKDRMLTESVAEKNFKPVDHSKKQTPVSEKEKDKRHGSSWKYMDAWKEKRNWEDILSSPFRASRFSHSPGLSRKSAERARILHDKLMSPEKKKKTALDLKKEAEEKHARAMRIRNELENEKVQKLQRNSEKLNRVNEWQTVRSMKLREGMYARLQRSESRHEAFLAQVVKRAGDESSKVNEVRFITSLNEENKKLILRQKLHDSELRRAEKLQVKKTKQKEDMAREEAVLQRRRLIEAEKLQRHVETQKRKEAAQIRREEERKASSAAREAKAIEQLQRKANRAKAQQEEAELMAQKLAEKLSESEQRRKFYLEQIRERASMDFRDQSSPLLRRSLNKEGQGRSTPISSGEEYPVNNVTGSGGSSLQTGNMTLQHSLKRRIKKIRQRLMALKYEFPEPSAGVENAGIGYRTAVGTARAKIGRWLQELQRLRQARKEGAASIGLIIAEMIKFLEGKEPELQASRQAGLLDFIASALPASHTSKPEACQVTVYLLRLLKVVLSVPANRSYFLSQNLLPPIIPLLAAALENYIKIAATSNVSGNFNLLPNKTSVEKLESISEALDGLLWIVATITGHVSSDERQVQMQDGLLELVLAYQVIHRLRDLFALYDRPQVEGSPFPSSILLGIKLLAVLTSRSRKISSIDWESFPVETISESEVGAKIAHSANGGCSSVTNPDEDDKPPESPLNHSIAGTLPDVPEDRPLDELYVIKGSSQSVLNEKDPDKVVVSTEIDVSDVLDELQHIPVDSNAIPSVSQKNEKGFFNECEKQKNENISSLEPSVAFLLSAIAETGLVCLPSLLTAVLLQANNRLSSEQASHILPSNFEEVATGVLKVLNNLALIDITFMQKMLARPDLKMEFFHLMSFLLSHCTSKWRTATDQTGNLLLESLLLLGYFALFHPENQAVLRWGKSPTILHKVCDLPFVFFSDPELMPVLAGTLVAACLGCEQNKGVVQLELSIEMLLSLLRSCRSSLMECSSESNQSGPESRKLQGDNPLRLSRHNPRSSQVSSGKGGVAGTNGRTSKVRSHKDVKALKLSEEMSQKQTRSALDTSALMLHNRFTESLIYRAEKFFAAESPV
ncbi:hypothetical protein NMG60_11004202 [Bertholletia excelsa]